MKQPTASLTTVLQYETLAELLSIAIEDLKKVEARAKEDSHVEIDMEDWVYLNPAHESCAVCMAGAVMIERLGAPSKPSESIRLSIEPHAFADDHTRLGLRAINQLRQGSVAEAWRTIHPEYDGLQLPEVFGGIPCNGLTIMPYSASPAGFWHDMNHLLQKLRTWNL